MNKPLANPDERKFIRIVVGIVLLIVIVTVGPYILERHAVEMWADASNLHAWVTAVGVFVAIFGALAVADSSMLSDWQGVALVLLPVICLMGTAIGLGLLFVHIFGPARVDTSGTSWMIPLLFR